MGNLRNVGMIAGLVFVAAIVGVALVTVFPLPLPPGQGAQSKVGSVTQSGLFTADSDGVCDVIAETDYAGHHIIGTARVKVGNAQMPPPPPPPPNATAHIDIAPAQAVLRPGESLQFIAQCIDKNGTAVPGANFAWSVRTLPLPQQGNNLPASQQDQPPAKDATFYYNAKSIISIINIALLGALTYIYISIYVKVKSRFTVGLILTMLALIVYALTSNPLLQVLFGFRATGLGIFAMVPDLFATVALSILLYLSME